MKLHSVYFHVGYLVLSLKKRKIHCLSLFQYGSDGSECKWYKMSSLNKQALRAPSHLQNTCHPEVSGYVQGTISGSGG